MIENTVPNTRQALADIEVPGPYMPLSEPFKSGRSLPEKISWAQAPNGLKTYLVNRYGEGISARNIDVTPEVTAYYLLDYLSGRPGQIRRGGSNRKGGSYRTQEYDEVLIDRMSESIKDGSPVPILISSFSPKLRNESITGGNLMPDMANYLAFINLHSIIAGSRKIYKPGTEINVGYEGRLYRALGRYSDRTIESTLNILNQLNSTAAERIHNSPNDNPIKLIDAADLVKECLIDHSLPGEELPQMLTENKFVKRLRVDTRDVKTRYETAKEEVNRYIESHVEENVPELERRKKIQGEPESSWYDFLRDHDALLPVLSSTLKTINANQGNSGVVYNHLAEQLDFLGQLESWMLFYRGTMSTDMMPEGQKKETYIKTMAFYWEAFSKLKYIGGKNNRGVAGFNDGVLPATVIGGRRMSLQLVPGFDYFPHHRLTAHIIKSDQQGEAVYVWRPIALKEMEISTAIFTPQYVDGYDYPFYYKQKEGTTHTQPITENGFNGRSQALIYEAVTMER